MSNARDLHHKAIDKLRKAEEALALNDVLLYEQHLKNALELETNAALMLKDKISAEPTRSVLFRSAASIALRCGEYKQAETLVLHALYGNPPVEIKSELLDVFSNALAEHTVIIPELAAIYKQQEYINSLRERAVNMKVATKGQRLASAVPLTYAINVMRNVKTSYSSYVNANMRRSFGHIDQSSRRNKLVKQIVGDDLLITDLKHASFGFSLSVDTVMVKDITQDIWEWKLDVFEAFKAEVIDFDYASLGKAEELASRYDENELRAIYSPIVSMLSESNNYIVSLTDKSFDQVHKVLKPIKRSVVSVIVPKPGSKDSDKKLYQAVGLAESGGLMKKEDIINMEEVQYMEFNHVTQNIHFDKQALYLKEPYTVKIEYNSGVFSIDAYEFGVSVSSNTYKDIVVKFYKAFIDLYVYIKNIKIDDLNIDDRDINEKLNNLIAMTSFGE